MKIFIMRHGEAEMLARSDKDRHLTAFGKAQSLTQGEWLKTQYNLTALDFDKIIVSPYVRAVETFEQVNQAFGGELSTRSEMWDAITPYGSAEVVVDYLETLGAENENLTVLIISHLPLVGEIVAELCGKNHVNFHPATIAEIDWDLEQGELITSHLAD